MSGQVGADALVQRLREDGFAVKDARIAGQVVSVGRRATFRWQWVATRLHVFVFVVRVVEAAALNGSEMATFVAAAQQYAVDHKGGLPRGLQTGSAAVPLLVTGTADERLRAVFEEEPQHRFAALVFPVLVEIDESRLTYFRGRMSKGHLYGGYLRQLVETVVAPAVGAQDGQGRRR